MTEKSFNENVSLIGIEGLLRIVKNMASESGLAHLEKHKMNYYQYFKEVLNLEAIGVQDSAGVLHEN